MFSFEKDFIIRLKNGDQESFGIFYTQTVDVFFRYAKTNYDIPKEEIEDILSIFYLKIRDNISTYNGGVFEAFVWTIFKNTIKDYFKKSSTMGFSELSREDHEGFTKDFEKTLVSDEDLSEFLEKQYKSDFIKNAVEQLDFDSQEIIFMKFVQDMSYEQIARTAGLSQDNVRQKLSRALKRLKEGIFTFKVHKLYS